MEGSKTEPAYFEALRRACRSALIEIEPHPGVGVPYTIAQRAAEHAAQLGLGRRRRGRKDSFETKDQVWAVFDRDEHPNYPEAVELCRNRGIRVARSDPCFELWLILHERDYDGLSDRHEVQAELRRLRPEYEIDGRKTPDCDDMVTRVEEAERRGKDQLQRREEEDRPYGNPSTTVGKLTKKIRKAARRAP